MFKQLPQRQDNAERATRHSGTREVELGAATHTCCAAQGAKALILALHLPTKQTERRRITGARS
jgi:hypothetical protein